MARPVICDRTRRPIRADEENAGACPVVVESRGFRIHIVVEGQADLTLEGLRLLLVEGTYMVESAQPVAALSIVGRAG
jgi:hypothetical protein